ncbi:MAG: tRNA (adenosine(37)-N6)-threonylcarbamoyltransferase complex ATPase subunit type 1 TsaE [Deltaproteobacteria bacterium]|nr:tRNA (adenosine(37)-N6)-threonylcarbamoyltransferase complex ATPase subunit type 1 TsaE [Deltaproteobacteria bacterium]
MDAKADVYVTNSPEETEALGAELAKGLLSSPGEVIGLVGELGAGKTSFVRGMARGLGVKGCVKSPSFTLINVYEGGSLPLYHIDLYRLAKLEELYGAGLEEYIYAKGISVIEWADKFPALYAECNIIVIFSYKGEDMREIEIRRR